MSKIKTEKNRDNRRDIELPPNATSDAPLEVEEQTGAEKLMMASQPYWGHIALGILVCILAWVIISYLVQNNRDAAAAPSRQLADAMQQFNVTSNVDSLKQMKTDYPNEIATNWAMLVAGDYELNRGLSQYASDREGAMRLIKRAKKSFEEVVDSPSTAKTTMQQRRSIFSLAYASESLGEFDEAKSLYQRVLDEAPNSIFTESAKRGLERANDPDFKKLYTEFAEYKPAMEEAPGAAVPDAPDIEFPAIDLPKEEPADDSSTAASSGDGSDANASETPVAKPATGVTETPATESSDSTATPATESTEPATTDADPSSDTGNAESATEMKEAVEAAATEATEAVKEVAEDAADGAKSMVEKAEEVVEEAKEAVAE